MWCRLALRERFKPAERYLELFSLVLIPLLLMGTLEAAQKTSPAQRQSQISQIKPQTQQQTFSSPQMLAEALYKAAASDDDQALLRILGPDGKQLLNWGTPAERKEERDTFAQKYNQMHRFVREPDGATTLYVGAENWPTPLPLVSYNRMWFVDTAAGEREILYRRIGRNELDAINVCHALVDAERDYSKESGNSNSPAAYAEKFTSDPGSHDGLYWTGGNGSSKSPIGPHLANAGLNSAAVSTQSNSTTIPFHGYFYKILLAQGLAAPGGAKSYLQGGKMTGGFAFVAFPAEYRVSGVKTFVVGANDLVYEKDLGPKTDQIAKSMKTFNPDSSWHKAE